MARARRVMARWRGRGIQHRRMAAAANRVGCMRVVVAINLRHVNPRTAIYGAGGRLALVGPWKLDKYDALSSRHWDGGDARALVVFQLAPAAPNAPSPEPTGAGMPPAPMSETLGLELAIVESRPLGTGKSDTALMASPIGIPNCCE